MALKIETFSNTSGGNALFKALGHPEAVPLAAHLIERLVRAGPVAIYDPIGQLASFAALYDLSAVQTVGVFVQDIERIGATLLGHRTQPVTALCGAPIATLFVAAFDAQRLVDQVRPVLPAGTQMITLDAMRLPDKLLTDRKRYLAPINFATNFAFFRDAGGHHTKLVTANYWGGYGAAAPWLWLTLFDERGNRLLTWEEALPAANGTIVLDSAELRSRFALPDFTGQLFLHIVDAAGHDVVKYALDTYGDDPAVLSCTHDANAWPSDLYAGLPAPRDGERVVLWVQNSHPCPIPAGAVGLNLMGDTHVAWLDRAVPGFGSFPLDAAALLPAARWPQQIEVQAGRHFVRPRYEIAAQNGRTRIAHANVERIDLKPDPKLPELGSLMGKGYILPAPILPPARFRTTVLPTPMSTAQITLPIQAVLFDAGGAEVARHGFGCLKRSDSMALDLSEVLAAAGARLASGYGHVELLYDFAAGREADGWLHAIFRYEDTASGHAAETSFGAHIFNTVLTYKDEPKSYASRPPGLSTRLFLRTGPEGTDTLCHLIYPASTPWHPHSATTLELTDRHGKRVAYRLLQIPCGGSHLFRVSETFTWEELRAAGADHYVLIRDLTCRLFGYHGLVRGETSFSLDHMFGF